MSRTKELFQEAAEKTHGIVTPGNVISAAGLAMVIYGALQEDKMKGTLFMGTGRVLDMVDGKVARATGTSSDTGAMVDATFDKIGMAVMVAKLIEQGAAPKAAIAYIIGQNAANATISVADFMLVDSEDQLQSSKAGKYAMLLQGSGLGFYLLANASEKERNQDVLYNIANSLTITSAGLAVTATKGYLDESIKRLRTSNLKKKVES